MHGKNNFPLRKMKSSLDVDLPDGCEVISFAIYISRTVCYMRRMRDEIVLDTYLYSRVYLFE